MGENIYEPYIWTSFNKKQQFNKHKELSKDESSRKCKKASHHFISAQSDEYERHWDACRDGDSKKKPDQF